VFGVIFWLLLGVIAIATYSKLRRGSGWAAFMEIALGIIGAAAADSGLRLSPLASLHGPAPQIITAVAGGLLLAAIARLFVRRGQ
jgi:uncharacterized membrane protein YeaQ/YmgE (transglycosylase-associated protein family)